MSYDSDYIVSWPYGIPESIKRLEAGEVIEIKSQGKIYCDNFHEEETVCISFKINERLFTEEFTLTEAEYKYFKHQSFVPIITILRNHNNSTVSAKFTINDRDERVSYFRKDRNELCQLLGIPKRNK